MQTPGRHLVLGMALLLSSFLAPVGAQTTVSSVTLSASALSFANQVVGTSSAPQTETVTVTPPNTPLSAIFGNIQLTGKNATDFTVQADTCSGANIYSGTCRITIVFHPSAAGVRSAAVSIQDNAAGSPQTFTLQGSAVALQLTSVVIAPSSPSVVSGSQIQLSAQGNYNDGSSKDITNTADWDSSDKKIATVRKGLATGVHAGRVIISAAVGKVAGQTPLGVEYLVSFFSQPTTTPVSKTIAPGVKVKILDNGSPVENLPVTIGLGPNPPNPAEVSGNRLRITGDDGTVTFDDLKLDYVGDGYRLVASTLGLLAPKSTALSAPFSETRVGDRCLGPNPACSSGCADTDGDGLNDAWEVAGGIDMNGDGRIDDKYDVLLRGANPHKQDVFVQYDWMGYSAPGNACNTNDDCLAAGAGGHMGETCTGPKVLPSANGSCVYACASDLSCTSRGPGHAQERCQASVCVHTHDPDTTAPGALQTVIDAYFAHGINLHLIRGHELPHSEVVSYRTGSQISDVCEGAAPPAVGLGQYAVSLYDLKGVSSIDPQKVGFHYSLFSHYSGCDTEEHCMACPPSRNPDGSIKTNPPNFGQSGQAEEYGNDFVVSLGEREVDLGHAGGIFSEGSTFMHELGHNLGLRHGGGSDDTNAKPNFLSIMNYRYQFTGIQYASSVGSSLPVGQRLDYSTQVLPVGGNTPGYLDQSIVPNSPTFGDPGLGLSEPAGLSSGVADIFSFTDARETGIPNVAASTGPVDWNGDRSFTGLNVQADTTCGPAGIGDHDCRIHMYPELKGNADWGLGGQNHFTYQFQCTPSGGPQGDGASVQKELSTRMATQAHVALPLRSIRIAIRPGCSGKVVAPGRAETVSVVLYGSNDFDIAEIDRASLDFHGAQLLGTGVQDIDGDGKPDLVATFDTRNMKLHPSATSARLGGWLKNSQVFLGEDAVTVVSGLSSASCR